MYLDKAKPVNSVAIEMIEGEKQCNPYLLRTHKPSTTPTMVLLCKNIQNIFNIASNQWNRYNNFHFIDFIFYSY